MPGFMWLKRIKKFIGFEAPGLSLENKLFNAVCLAVGFSMILGLVTNILEGFPVTLIVVEIFIGAISVFAFYKSRYGGYNQTLVLAYITSGIILFIPGWFFNGGIEGSTTQIGVFLVVLIMILVKRKYHLFYIGLLMAVFLGCYLLEKRFPQWITSVANTGEKETDLISSAITNILMAGLLVSFLKRSHEKDKNNLIKKSE